LLPGKKSTCAKAASASTVEFAANIQQQLNCCLQNYDFFAHPCSRAALVSPGAIPGLVPLAHIIADFLYCLCLESSLPMEMFSTPWWSALMAIVLIDLVLAGDNAIVIALAARNLPAQLKRKASSGARWVPSWCARP
jgi:hypothetical protein